MNWIISFFMLVGLNVQAQAGDLPAWVEKTCKLHAYEQIIDLLKEKEYFYKISNVKSTEKTLNSGQLALTTNVLFDDSKNCLNRSMVAVCIPLDLKNPKNPVLFQFSMTDCDSQSVQKTLLL